MCIYGCVRFLVMCARLIGIRDCDVSEVVNALVDQ